MKALYYLRVHEGFVLKNVTATDIANRNTGTIVKVVWSLFSRYIIFNLGDIDGKSLTQNVKKGKKNQTHYIFLKK